MKASFKIVAGIRPDPENSLTKLYTDSIISSTEYGNYRKEEIRS